MGGTCCKLERQDTSELKILSILMLKLLLEEEVFEGFPVNKSGSKKKKSIELKKTGTDAVAFNPGTFVIESQGVLKESYEFLCKLGEGIICFI